MKLSTKHPTSKGKEILNLKEDQIKIPWHEDQAVSYDNGSFHTPSLNNSEHLLSAC